MAFKSGFVAIVGRPNAGKSTLVNTLVGRKVAIVSPKPQTTRNRIQGILNRDDAQIVLVDTPGIHKAANVLSRQMMDELQHALEGIDVLSLIVDASAHFGPGDDFSLEWVKRFHGPVFLLLNKVDRVNKPHLLPLIDRYRQLYDFAEIFPISALTGEGCLDLVNAWLARLPEAPPYFPEDQFTDQPERFLAARARPRESDPCDARGSAARDRRARRSFRGKERSHQNSRHDVRRARRSEGNSDRQGRRNHQENRHECAEGARIHPGAHIFLELSVNVQPNWRQNSALVRQLDWHRQLEQLGEFQ